MSDEETPAKRAKIQDQDDAEMDKASEAPSRRSRASKSGRVNFKKCFVCGKSSKDPWMHIFQCCRCSLEM